MTDKAKTLGSIIQSGSDFLAGKNIENPRLLCEILAARLISCKRLELPLQHDTLLSEKQLDAMRRGLKRLVQGEPVQYIVGETEFMGYKFKTDKRALIPRPETELLVETVLGSENIWAPEKPVIVEMGTGSGCITISLALAQPDALFIALDISEDAVQLAKENAAKNNIAGNVAFAVSDLADSVDPETIDAIVANLPYIATDECESLATQVKDHEPRMALDGGPDGLAIIEPVIQDAAFALKPGGRIFLEIGETQAESVSAMLTAEGYTDIKVIKDLNKRDRVVTAKLVLDAGC